ncbi:SpoIIE family protein phosphatase [Streptomyces sp. NPDC056159]|uniref:ATP-binding SpoIIE family protein phosphatase n=1 Tax=unclassified Streptomyces TaxID=2593676 RepID=UPI003432D292
MAATHRLDERLFTLLVGYIALFSALVLEMSGGGRLRWALYAVFAPLVAAALLPFKLTLAIGVLSAVAAGIVYGLALPHVLPGGRVVVIVGTVLACALSVAVCRIRLRLMISRRRLALLSEASKCFGNTLDVTQTARGITEVAVPRFADFVSVGVFDGVLRGKEPPTGPFAEPVALRLIAQQPRCPGRNGSSAGEHPQVSLPARYLNARPPVQACSVDDVDVRRWIAQDGSLATPTDDGGGYAAITVPLCARGSVLGAMMLLRHRRRYPFDADDLFLAAELATRAAECLDNARLYTRERETSLILQHSLLPRHLPELAAVEVASRYVPANHGAGVGGDWFDVIPLSGARVALVVGDVVGHGLHASATMTRLRAAVRTLADIDLQPDELLTHLDDVVLRLSTESTPTRDAEDAFDAAGSAGEVGATCLYAIYDPATSRCVLASAGHPPPVMVAPDGSIRVIDVPPGPLLGLGNLPFEAVDVHVPQGSLLALYTNGLLREHHSAPDSGLRELLHALSRPEPSLEEHCQAVLGALLDGQPTDDVALLMARTRILDADHVATWDLPPDPAAVADAREYASRQLAAWQLQDAQFTTELVVSELVTNAIRYAQPPIQLRLILEADHLTCEVSDSSTTTPHLRRARTFDEGGRGLFIVAQLARRWGTRHRYDGKTIWAELATGDGGPDLWTS